MSQLNKDLSIRSITLNTMRVQTALRPSDLRAGLKGLIIGGDAMKGTFCDGQEGQVNGWLANLKTLEDSLGTKKAAWTLPDFADNFNRLKGDILGAKAGAMLEDGTPNPRAGTGLIGAFLPDAEAAPVEAFAETRNRESGASLTWFDGRLAKVSEHAEVILSDPSKLTSLLDVARKCLAGTGKVPTEAYDKRYAKSNQAQVYANSIGRLVRYLGQALLDEAPAYSKVEPVTGTPE